MTDAEKASAIIKASQAASDGIVFPLFVQAAFIIPSAVCFLVGLAVLIVGI